MTRNSIRRSAYMGWYILAICSLLYCIMYLLPSSVRFKYHDIIPTKEVYKHDETLTFKSERQVNITTNLYGNDMLICDLGGDEHVVGTSTRSNLKAQSKPRGLTLKREYNGAMPLYTTTCKIRAVVCTNVIRERCQDEIESKPFTIQSNLLGFNSDPIHIAMILPLIPILPADEVDPALDTLNDTLKIIEEADQMEMLDDIKQRKSEVFRLFRRSPSLRSAQIINNSIIVTLFDGQTHLPL